MAAQASAPTPTRTPAVAMLTTLLRSLQSYTDLQDTPRLLGTTSALLSTLTNPLNDTVLTSQLLTAPAIWTRPDGLRTCQSVMAVFHSAAVALARMESEKSVARHTKTSSGGLPLPGSPGGITRDEWAKAIIDGADDRSPRWKHLLVLAGLVSGFETAAKQGFGRDCSSWWSFGCGTEPLTPKLRAAFVVAVNAVVADLKTGPDGQPIPVADDLGAQCLSLVMNAVFQYLTDHDLAALNFDGLVAVFVSSAFHSPEGFRSAYVIGSIDADVVELPDGKLSWPQLSPSFEQVSKMPTRPLIQNIGPLSVMIARAVELARHGRVVHLSVLETLLTFSKSLVTQWRINRLSAIDQADQSDGLDGETCSQTMPVLWDLLKKAAFSIVIILRAVAARMLSDRVLAADHVSYVMANQLIHTLRNLSFLTTRLGIDHTSQYQFVFLSAIDIVSAFPPQAEALVRSTEPLEPGQIPHLPLDRCLDLFFLNLAEHLTLTLTPATTEEIVIAAVTPYLTYGGHSDSDSGNSETNRRRKRQLMPLFEAAHSVMLSVFSASTSPSPLPFLSSSHHVAGPSRTGLASKYVPFYADTLFAAFPDSLSPKQFRLAFKTLIRVLTTPHPTFVTGLSAVSNTGGDVLAPTLLEILSCRARQASSKLLPSSSEQPIPSPSLTPQRFSERSTLVLALIDSLPFLPVPTLSEWLPVTAQLVNDFPSPAAATGPDDEYGPAAASVCKDRLWNVLVGGEMDPVRAYVCMVWWTTGGGREMVVDGVGALESSGYESHSAAVVKAGVALESGLERKGSEKERRDGDEPRMSGAAAPRSRESKL